MTSTETSTTNLSFIEQFDLLKITDIEKYKSVMKDVKVYIDEYEKSKTFASDKKKLVDITNMLSKSIWKDKNPNLSNLMTKINDIISIRYIDDEGDCGNETIYDIIVNLKNNEIIEISAGVPHRLTEPFIEITYLKDGSVKKSSHVVDLSHFILDEIGDRSDHKKYGCDDDEFHLILTVLLAEHFLS
jgi:hypothetical protein